MVEGASQNADKRAQNTRLAAARSSLTILWAAVDMAHEAGGFKVNYAHMVSAAENSTRNEGLGRRFGCSPGVLAPAPPAGNLAKLPILHIIWTVCRQSIQFFGLIFEQSTLRFPGKNRYFPMISIGYLT
jgi:hypothetical protein